MIEPKEDAGQINGEDAHPNNPAPLARRSTGPRTPGGKERSKHNAIRHAIFSKVILLPGEPRAVFDALLKELFEDLRPAGALERILVEKIAVLVWRYRRLLAAEAETSKGIDLLELSNTTWSTDRLLRYETAIGRDFERSLMQLERLQRMRLGDRVPPPIKLDISHDPDLPIQSDTIPVQAAPEPNTTGRTESDL